MSAKTRLIFEGENRTVQAFNAVNRSLDRMGGRIRTLAFSAKGFITLIAGGALTAATREQIQFADSVQKLGIRLRQSTEDLSVLAFAAERSNVELRTLENAVRTLQNATGEALRGTKTYADAFDALAIDARKFSQLPIIQQTRVLAEQFNKLSNDAQRINLAQRLFGGRGVAFLQLLDEGAAGIDELAERARELGFVVGQEGADRAARAEDAFTDLSASFRGFLLQITESGALDALTSFINGLADLVATWRGTKRVVTEVNDEIRTYTSETGKAVAITRELAEASAAVPNVLKAPKIEPTVQIIKGPKEEAEKEFSELQSTISSSIQAGIDEGATGMVQTFSRALQRMAADLLSSALIRLLGSFFTGGGGFLGGLGSRQSGGRVEPGQLVQTHGLGAREFFIPDTTGRVVPASNVGGGAGVSIVQQIDARGADAGVETRIALAMRRSLPAIKAAVFDDLKRAGRL